MRTGGFGLCSKRAQSDMISHMTRTTLILQDRRLADLKRLAAERGETLSSLVDQFLAEGLSRSRAPKRRLTRLPAFRMGEPLVDINDRDRLFDAMDRR